MSRTQMLQIQFNDVALGYEKKRVVEGLSLTIHSGDYLGVIGENGVGKSTFIKTLLGLIPPVSGQIQWGGRRCPSGVGYLPQMTAASRNFPAVVKEIVLSGRLGHMGYRPFYSGKDRQLAQNAMEQVGIAGLLKNSPSADCPAVSSNGCFWHGRCVRPLISWFWMSRSAGWTPKVAGPSTPW